jgi:hypothetical protein
LRVSAEERRPISPWIGALALVGGIALVVNEARRRA